MARAVKKGKWADQPWTGCPYCSHGITGDNQDARINQHMVSRHSGELRASELEKMGGEKAVPDSKPVSPTGHAGAKGGDS